MYETLKKLYVEKKATIEMLEMAVLKKWITEEQLEEIRAIKISK